MPEDRIQQTTDGERGRFVQLLKEVEAEFWRVTRERDEMHRRALAAEAALKRATSQGQPR